VTGKDADGLRIDPARIGVQQIEVRLVIVLEVLVFPQRSRSRTSPPRPLPSARRSNPAHAPSAPDQAPPQPAIPAPRPRRPHGARRVLSPLARSRDARLCGFPPRRRSRTPILPVSPSILCAGAQRRRSISAGSILPAKRRDASPATVLSAATLSGWMARSRRWASASATFHFRPVLP